MLIKVRRHVQAFDSQIQKYGLWRKLWAKDTQKYKVDIFRCSTFLYGRKHGLFIQFLFGVRYIYPKI